MRTRAASRHLIVLASDTLLFWDYFTVHARSRVYCSVYGLPTPELLLCWSTNGPMLAVEQGQGEA